MAPSFLQVVLGLAALLFASTAASAESHTIQFDNKCGHGTPTLILNGQVVSTGQPYTASGHIVGGIAYLQNNNQCGFNGENCALVEMTLGNPTCPGCGSSTDISLIAPHAFNVETSFSYFNGCDGQGATCNSANCNTAFFQPDDNQVQVQCEANDVNLLITFCGDATKDTPGKPAAPPATSATSAPPVKSPAPVHTSSAAHSSAPAVENVAPKPPIAGPLSLSSAAPAASSPAAPAASSPAAPAASSPAVDRPLCRNRRRSNEAPLLSRAEQESRALYDLHRRRHHAQRRGHAAAAEAHLRSF